MEYYKKKIEITIVAKDKDDARNRFNWLIAKIQEPIMVEKMRVIK